MKQQVCIIIPVYNRIKLLRGTLDSVLKQSLPPKRLIICDDGSTDRTLIACQGWIKKNTPSFEVKILHLPHKGAGASRNAGLKYQLQKDDCDLVCFLDSDDVVPFDFLNRCELSLRKDPNLVGVCIPSFTAHQDHSIFYNFENFVHAPISWMLREGASLLSCSVLRLRMVKAAGYFEEDVLTGHDMLFFDKLLDQGPMRALGGRATLLEKRTLFPEEAFSLSETATDRYFIWAQIREKIIRRRNLSFIPYRKILYLLWKEACKDALKQRKFKLILVSFFKLIIYHSLFSVFLRFIRK